MDLNEQHLIRYLLGELPEGEQAALEAQYFADSRVFDQIVAVENKLVDDFARGRLPTGLRARFERSYSADPARRERVKFAEALAAMTDANQAAAAPSAQVSWWQNSLAALRGLTPVVRYSVAFATLLVVLFGAWSLVNAWRRQREAAQIQANANQQQRERAEQSEKERKRAEEIAAGKERVKETPPIPLPTPTPTPIAEPSSVTLALTIGGVRGGGGGTTPTVALAPATTQVRLVLSLTDNEYPTYRASLQTAAGAEVLSQANLKPARSKGGASFVVTVPARKLPPGEYVLKLSGVSSDGEVDDLSKSLFRVVRK